jgi:hypothetical protein
MSSLLNSGKGSNPENLSKWERWVSLLDEKLRPMMESYGIPFTRTKYKWGPKSNIPAMISGRSSVLVSNAHNNTVKSLNELRKEQGLKPLESPRAYHPEFLEKPPGLVARCISAIKNLLN